MSCLISCHIVKIYPQLSQILFRNASILMLKTALNFGVMIIFFPFFSVRVKEKEIDSFDRLKKEFDFIRFFFFAKTG